jgi:hypothetical protein
MIERVKADAFRCTACGWMWFTRVDGVVPKRCPRRSCRKMGRQVMPNAGDTPKLRIAVTGEHRAETSAEDHLEFCQERNCETCKEIRLAQEARR